MRSIVSLLRVAAFSLAFLVGGTAAAQPVAGRDYTILQPAQPTESAKRDEVLEFFWYACPHCYALQPPLRVWLKQKPADVDFKRVPAVFSDSWVALALAYYSMEEMGIVNKLHYDVFDAIHEQKFRLSDPNVLFEWIGKQGVDAQKFAEIYNSSSVRTRAKRSIDMTIAYDIPGTPALVVDGKYIVSPSMILKPDQRTVDYDRYFNVLDQVIARARKERASAK